MAMTPALQTAIERDIVLSRPRQGDKRQSKPLWWFKAIGRPSFVAARVIGWISDSGGAESACLRRGQVPQRCRQPVCWERCCSATAQGAHGYRKPQREVHKLVLSSLLLRAGRLVLDGESLAGRTRLARLAMALSNPNKCRRSGMTDGAERACIVLVTGVTAPERIPASFDSARGSSVEWQFA
jgi:hypothetical protein